MWFSKFYRACEKYEFTFSFCNFERSQIVLRPNETYGEDIRIEANWYKNDKMLFRKAIQTMKNYRMNKLD